MIPKQLQNPNYRFILLKKNDAKLEENKQPKEKNWQKTNNYFWKDSRLLDHISKGNNYGIVCGFGNLVGIDADSKIVQELAEKNLPETFTVETWSGKKHYYYEVEDEAN